MFREFEKREVQLDFATEERIISYLCLKQPLTCFLLSNYFQKTGRNAVT